MHEKYYAATLTASDIYDLKECILYYISKLDGCGIDTEALDRLTSYLNDVIEEGDRAMKEEQYEI